MYYNRFGRCNRGERCPYVHDPEKVAVCTRCVPHPQAGAGRRGVAGGHGCPGLPPLRPALCAQVCPGHLQEDGRDLPLLPPRLQGEGELPPCLRAGAAPRLPPSTLLGPPGPLCHPLHAQRPAQVRQGGPAVGEGGAQLGFPQRGRLGS